MQNEMLINVALKLNLMYVCSVVSEVLSGIWEHKRTLIEYWEKGMIGVGTSEQKGLVAECGSHTGLTYTQIKVTLCHHNCTAL